MNNAIQSNLTWIVLYRVICTLDKGMSLDSKALVHVFFGQTDGRTDRQTDRRTDTKTVDKRETPVIVIKKKYFWTLNQPPKGLAGVLDNQSSVEKWKINAARVSGSAGFNESNIEKLARHGSVAARVSILEPLKPALHTAPTRAASFF